MTFSESEFTLPQGTFELSSEMDWNGVTLFTPDGSALPDIFYKNKQGAFVFWPVTENPDETENKSLLELLIIEPGKNSLIIRSSETVNVVAHFYNTRIPGENLKAELLSDTNMREDEKSFSPLDDDTFDDPETGLARRVKRPQYISREGWGADENLRIWNPSKRRFFQTWFKTEQDIVKPHYRPKVIKTQNKDGKPLRWPLAQSPVVKKFIIHHTGEYVENGRDPMEIMRAIYAFHTLTRGWGDIGYNYVIDKQGNIYEGRAGGPDIVGAHTAYHNIGTIGVSLMGNFEYEEPTNRQMEVLKILLADHARRFDIDPNKRSSYLDTYSWNVSGHRDVARPGHGTSCPGKNLAKRLPQLRKEVAYLMDVLYRQDKSDSLMARDFLQKSDIAPKFVQTPSRFKRPEKTPMIQIGKLITKQILQRNDRKTVDLEFKNGTNDIWKAKNSKLLAENIPEGMTVTPFRAVESVKPEREGVFRGRIVVRNVPNGVYEISLYPEFLKGKIFHDQELPSFVLPIQVSGEKVIMSSNPIPRKKEVSQKPSFLKKLSATMFHHSAAKQEQPKVKVKLAFFDEDYAYLEGNQKVLLREGDKKLALIAASTPIKISPEVDLQSKKKFLKVQTKGKTWSVGSLSAETDGILKIKNYDRGLGKLAYNRFRKQLNFHPKTASTLIVVNELPIEEYLGGLAEEPTSEPDAKKHAIHILARSYAYVYSGTKRKFGTHLYDLEDDPASSQFYLGYDWEQYHVSQKELLSQTEGQILTYQRKPVIGPYFTQSAGHSSDKWHRAYPWAKVQPLPFDKGLEQKGHGVGLSGNSARFLAEQGKNHEEIIDYFFEGVRIEKKY
jgi:hypothetical protein